MKRGLFFILLYLIQINVNVQAKIINVPAQYPTIQSGINASNDGDTVLVQPGTFKENIVFKGKSIVLASTYILYKDTSAIRRTIIDGQWWDCAVTINQNEKENTMLIGFSITNGVRGVMIYSSNASISHCRIYNNIVPGDTSGGGVLIIGYGAPGTGYNVSSVYNCEIFNNKCRFAGGLALVNNRGIVESCKIYDNTDYQEASQVQFASSNTAFRNCYVQDLPNWTSSLVSFGGGGSPLFTNNIIVTNRSIPNNYQAVFNSGAQCNPLLINNTIVNKGAKQSDLVHIYPPSFLSIYNSIAVNLLMNDGMGYKSEFCRFDNVPVGKGNINANPKINTDYSLANCSPCIGAGIDKLVFNNTTYNAPTNDYLYKARPQTYGSMPDMGAIENIYGLPHSPVASITIQGPITICEGTSVNLTALFDSTFKYNWLKDNILVPNISGSNYQVAKSGIYKVIVSDGICKDTSDHISVTVIPYPDNTLKISSDTTFCQGGFVILSAPSNPGYTFQWFNNNSPISNAISNSYTATESGNYSFKVTSGVCSSFSRKVKITVNPKPVSIISLFSSPDCESGPVTLKALTSPGYAYQWFKNNLIISDAIDSIYTAVESGSYSVVVSKGICSNTSELVHVSVIPYPDKIIGVSGSTSFCQGGQVNLNAVTNPEYSYQWFKNNDMISNATSDHLTAAEGGYYSVKITTGNCSVTSDPVQVTVLGPVPDKSLKVTGSTTFCQGGSVKLEAAVNPGYSYQWFKNDILITGSVNNSLTVAESGTYTVKVTSNTCSVNSEPARITVNPIPNSTILYSGPTSFCAGSSLKLYVNPIQNATYLWNNGATSSSIIATQSGNYTVVVTKDGCFSLSQIVPVTVNPKPAASITVTGNTTICEGDNVILTADGGDTYQWNIGSTAKKITITKGGNYIVNVTSNGCTSTASQLVVVNSKPMVSIPLSNKYININSIPVYLSGAPGGGIFSGIGITGNIFNPIKAGLGKKSITYFYKDSLGCSDVASQNIIVYDTTGVYCSVIDTLIIYAKLTVNQQIAEYHLIKIYPNPAKTHLYISFSDFAFQNGYMVLIKNSLGQLVFQSVSNQQLYTVNLSGWSGKGIYVVQVKDKSGTIIDTKKIVIQ